MKKLNLNVANLGATEVLSREELKKVLGGTGTGTGSGGGSGCSSYTSKSTCSASCSVVIESGATVTGDCRWVTNESACKCAVAYPEL